MTFPGEPPRGSARTRPLAACGVRERQVAAVGGQHRAAAARLRLSPAVLVGPSRHDRGPVLSGSDGGSPRVWSAFARGASPSSSFQSARVILCATCRGQQAGHLCGGRSDNPWLLTVCAKFSFIVISDIFRFSSTIVLFFCLLPPFLFLIFHFLLFCSHSNVFSVAVACFTTSPCVENFATFLFQGHAF